MYLSKSRYNLSNYNKRISYLEWKAGDSNENLEEKNLDLLNCSYKIKTVRGILDSDEFKNNPKKYKSDNKYNENKGYLDKMWLEVGYIFNFIDFDNNNSK